MVFAMIILDWHTRFWLRQGAIIRDLDLDVIAILLHTLFVESGAVAQTAQTH